MLATYRINFIIFLCKIFKCGVIMGLMDPVLWTDVNGYTNKIHVILVPQNLWVLLHEIEICDIGGQHAPSNEACCLKAKSIQKCECTQILNSM